MATTDISAKEQNFLDEALAARPDSSTGQTATPRTKEEQDFLNEISAIPQSNIQINAPPIQRNAPMGIEQYARPNVPLDVTTGVGFWRRAGLSFITDPSNRQAYIRNAFAGSTVDQTRDGQLIVRNVLDQATGKTKGHACR